MLFVGERLDVDGNDYPVIATGVPTLADANWEPTVEVIERMLADATH